MLSGANPTDPRSSRAAGCYDWAGAGAYSKGRCLPYKHEPDAHHKGMPGRLREETRAGGAIVSLVGIGLIIVYIVYEVLILYLYGRRGRWSGFVGWSLLVGAAMGFTFGLAAAFPWGGLVFLGITVVGFLLVIVDVARGRRRRR